ncbi:hypothetical protein [Pseudarthrobacter chlorophenolicus]|uniref:hypothetical protein n=1 Tax=Pseudarthrobacter chlorophenolicus TaxID=85085 RepID=UPI00126A63FB|nr:hypothetical protein [Pseudarthrobacter chlorophenolicus]
MTNILANVDRPLRRRPAAEDRCIRTPEARASLPKGIITIEADDCLASGISKSTSAGIRPTVVLPAPVLVTPKFAIDAGETKTYLICF